MVDEQTLLLVAIVAISVAAHVSIAWTAIWIHTRRAERKWTAKVEEDMIPKAAEKAVEGVKAWWKDLPDPVEPMIERMRASFEEEGFPQMKVELPTDLLVQMFRSVPDQEWKPLTDRINTCVSGVLNERIAHNKDEIVEGVKSAAGINGLAGWSKLLGARKADLQTFGGWIQLMVTNPLGPKFVNAVVEPLGWRFTPIAQAEATSSDSPWGR